MKPRRGRFFKLVLRGIHRKPKRKKQARVVSKKSPVTRPRGHIQIENLPAVLGAEASQNQTTALLPEHFLTPGSELLKSIEAFLIDQRSQHTRRAYQKDLKRFVRFLGVRRLQGRAEAITRSTLIAYKESLLSDKLEHTTVDRHLSTLKSFFRWLLEDGVIEKSPADGVRFLNPKRISRTLGLTDEDVQKILAQPDIHTRTGAQHYAILNVLLYCGLRRSELCQIKANQLVRERGSLVLRLRGKGNSERLVVITPPVENALNHHFRVSRRDPSGDSYLFTPLKNPRGGGNLSRPLDPSAIFYIVARYAKLAGIKARISPHSCRATAISNARDRNAPDRAIQEFAGWASPDMITRYDKRRTSIENSAAHLINYGAKDRIRPRG